MVKRQTTHREYLAWKEWLDEQWSEPNRSDHYLMQIAHEIRRTVSKKKKKISDFKIPFKKVIVPIKKVRKKKKKKELDVKTLRTAAVAKVRWFGMLGIKALDVLKGKKNG